LLLEFTGYVQKAASLPDKKAASLPDKKATSLPTCQGQTSQKQLFFVDLNLRGTLLLQQFCMQINEVETLNIVSLNFELC
jgi:hypothetical protein